MADVKLAYRLYKDTRQDSSGKALLIYFHANAELCTDLETDVHQFFDCGFGAVLCPEFRGYAWSEGTPSLRSLYPDSEALINALPEILETNDLQLDMPIIVLGRSLGSACAIHLATAPNVCGLIIESGVMELLKLPMVMQFAMMMPQLLQALRQEPSPLKPLEELRQVRIPTVVIHGELDEMSPIDQAFAAHGACASPEKKLVKLFQLSREEAQHMRWHDRELIGDRVRKEVEQELGRGPVVYQLVGQDSFEKAIHHGQSAAKGKGKGRKGIFSTSTHFLVFPRAGAAPDVQVPHQMKRRVTVVKDCKLRPAAHHVWANLL
eukprot:g24786.t1